MPAKKAKKAEGKPTSGARSAPKKQSKTAPSKASTKTKQRTTTKRNAPGVGATLKKAGQTVAEVVTDAVDSVAKATGLKSKKK